MIRYNDWGKHIRLGNWLFLYAGIQSIIKDSDNAIAFPDYFLWKYLNKRPNVTTDVKYDSIFHFRQTNYTIEEKQYLKDYFIKNKDKQININLGSHLQSEKWFIEDIDYIKECLELKKEYIDIVREKYKYIFTKPTIGIGIRRGDFVNHGCFYQIPEDWYLKALESIFSDWETYNIVFFSDDIEWCKAKYKHSNMFFAEPNNTHTHADGFKHYHKDPMEQFILGTLMNHFIGGNSTFTWLQMWYVKNFNNGIVLHCGENLRGECIKQFNNPDYYPSNWTLYK